MRLVRVFFLGNDCEFSALYLLGTLNVAAMQISLSEGVREAVYFSADVF